MVTVTVGIAGVIGLANAMFDEAGHSEGPDANNFEYTRRALVGFFDGRLAPSALQPYAEFKSPYSSYLESLAVVEPPLAASVPMRAIDTGGFNRFDGLAKAFPGVIPDNSGEPVAFSEEYDRDKLLSRATIFKFADGRAVVHFIDD